MRKATMSTLTSSEAFAAAGRRITTELLVWNDITVLVSFEPDWLNLAAGGFDSPWAHLELQVLEPRGAPLPVSDTGYWSEFFDLSEAEEAGGACALAASYLTEMAVSQSWLVAWARWEQRDLFG
jgi:hypothetical protein